MPELTLFDIALHFPVRFLNAVSLAFAADEDMLSFKVQGFTLGEYKASPSHLTGLAMKQANIGIEAN